MTKRKIEYWVIPPASDGEFVAHMENVLDTYAQAYDPAHPVLCMDEQPVQLVGETRVPIAATKEHPQRVDYEYERLGTANIFLFAEPLSGFRQATARPHRTKVDWATELAPLLDTRYADCDWVTLVCDNLNTHTIGAFYEAFDAETARAYVRRLRFVYTPKHGSWLNVAECELSCLTSQCLRGRRIGDLILLAAAPGGRAQPTDADVKEWAREVADRADGLDYRRGACRRLGLAADRFPAAVTALVGTLADEKLAYWAAEGLWKSGPNGRAAARAYGQRGPADAPLARTAAELAAADDPPFSGLLKLVDARDPAVRRWAVETLVALGEANAKVGKPRSAVVGYLRKAAEEDADPRLRGTVTLALAGFGPDPGLVPLLIRLVAEKSTTPADRATAARRLGELGPDAAAAALPLVAALADPDRETRRAAAGALGRIGEDGPAVVEALRGAAARADTAAAAGAALRAVEARQEQAREVVRARIRQELVGQEVARIEAAYQMKVREIERDQAAFRREQAERFADSFRDKYRHTAEDYRLYAEWYERERKRMAAWNDGRVPALRGK